MIFPRQGCVAVVADTGAGRDDKGPIAAFQRQADGVNNPLVFFTTIDKMVKIMVKLAATRYVNVLPGE
ncbi:hypothetical protein ABR32_16355 [Enterobacter cloacae subsp. dissolvens]|uniref:hypothetical protein n=1 Tax=Enterobacter cloacae TaxID=550 RepID=UPI000642CAA4|nr:hypothetical protein [Enterobacter cloacae]KLQ37087.1 hypothetical protein ABR32_16355 [Enterobacter cloacae subsp. dissolvens]ELR9129150.1 hypothetical protein [Enterobacter cloacae]MCK7316687.1 hypothetical protein [Enterobacter cloacae]RHI06025.1 hypothetical protein DW184_02715 [Enterobacter cloacae]HEW9968037.1 hypothetical protein [Enterobacter cloacae]